MLDGVVARPVKSKRSWGHIPWRQTSPNDDAANAYTGHTRIIESAVHRVPSGMLYLPANYHGGFKAPLVPKYLI